MNTYQTSIKTGILLLYFGNPLLWYQIYENTTVVHTELKQEGKVRRTNGPPKYIS